MANKKDFKKSIDAIGAAVCNEMMIVYYNVEGADRNAITSSIENILAAVVKAKNNSNVIFDKGLKAFANRAEYAKSKAEFYKALFAKIHAEFGEELNAAVKEFNNAIPADVKKANKETLAE